MGKVNLHIGFSQLFGAIVGSFILSFALLGLVNIGERALPRTFWFEYHSVVPAKESFKKGELLSFVSTTTRHRDIDMERQDTAYCDDGTFTQKYQMQRRPVTGTERMTKGERKGVWKYFIPIEDHELTCKMCGSAIGYTDHGYKKIYSYCTNEFKVNQ